MPGCPRPSACITVPYELVNVAAHGVPVVVSLEEFEGFGTAWMSEGRGIVVALHEVQPKVLVSGDKETVSVEQDTPSVLAVG